MKEFLVGDLRDGNKKWGKGEIRGCDKGWLGGGRDSGIDDSGDR